MKRTPAKGLPPAPLRLRNGSWKTRMLRHGGMMRGTKIPMSRLLAFPFFPFFLSAAFFSSRGPCRAISLEGCGLNKFHSPPQRLRPAELEDVRLSFMFWWCNHHVAVLELRLGFGRTEVKNNGCNADDVLDGFFGQSASCGIRLTPMMTSDLPISR